MTDGENKKLEEQRFDLSTAQADLKNSPRSDLGMVSIEDFAKLKIKIGKILSAEKVPDADKLIKFTVDLGEGSPRQILSGIAMHYPDPSVLVGKQVPVLTNLAPRVIRGHESQGMILYAVGEGEHFTTVEPAKEVPVGTPLK
ncbi:MAG: hypothetical protein Q7S11_03160 [bacterium]|nr:hypothetical protein [bacterium]